MITIEDMLKSEIVELVIEQFDNFKEGFVNIKDEITESVKGFVQAEVLTKQDKKKVEIDEINAKSSKEGWVILKEKIVEFLFEVILICSFFYPDWSTAITLCLLLGFKLFGAYLGKIFQEITQSKDKQLIDKDKVIEVDKGIIDTQAKQIYKLEAKLIQNGLMDDVRLEAFNDKKAEIPLPQTKPKTVILKK